MTPVGVCTAVFVEALPVDSFTGTATRSMREVDLLASNAGNCAENREIPRQERQKR